MHFKQLEDIKIETNIRGVDSRMMVDIEAATIKELVLKANEQIPPHQVPVDVTFFVLEGEGTITIGETKYDVKPHSIVTCPKNTVMSVKAKNNYLAFINIKTPGFKPTK